MPTDPRRIPELDPAFYISEVIISGLRRDARACNATKVREALTAHDAWEKELSDDMA